MPETLIELEGAPDARGKRQWFTLLGPNKGDRGVYLKDGLEGLGDMPFDSIWNSHAFQIGSTFGGIRIDHLDVLMGVTAKATPGFTAEENDSNFRLAWSAKKDANLWVTSANARRRLPLRMKSNPQLLGDIDPHVNDVFQHLYTLRAGDPRWLESDLKDSWKSTRDTTDGSTQTGHVTISNPTDTEQWLMWVVQAAKGAKWTLPDFSFGDDREDRGEEDRTRLIRMPELIDGEHLKVNTDQTEVQVASNIDTQVWERMRSVLFCYPLPARSKKVKLPVSVTNAPAGVGVQVRCPRKWSRPWGLQ
ncbi:hypothetical protein CH253_08095 [Rhodococcus sp. 06-156-3C]|uniref:hypothetical protein n=1 Tax=Rhodococcus sp. 06-156-3C TaxID=2022486 RepID=UPI000B9C3304|nr:hypothetical protein [Rhodococcus sp. 06-156-3C]OZD23813.1 hypothetical protein CH253_08095 [Rhodococcus sp. 06-156-3C]